MTIGEKIKRVRMLNHMTQKSLGETCGIGEATIRKYELGIRNPKQEQIQKIANALNIPVCYLCSVQADENEKLKEMSDTMKTVIKGTKTISEYKKTQDMMKKLAVELSEVHKSAVEDWQNGEIEKTWFDHNGNLCIEYTSGNWWHYNEKGEWW